MAFSTRNFDPFPYYPPNLQSFALQILVFFCLDHTVPVIIDAHVLQTYFYTTMGKGSCLWKTTLEPKLVGAGLAEHPQKIGTPYLFMQPLKLASLNLVLSLGLGVAYQKTTFTIKIGGGPG